MREKGTQTQAPTCTHNGRYNSGTSFNAGTKVAQMVLKETFSMYRVNMHTLLLQSRPIEKAGCLLN